MVTLSGDRHPHRSLLVLACAILLCRALSAQSAAAPQSAPALRGWLGGAVGSAGDGSGAVLQWEGALGYGLFEVGYQDSRSDDFSGNRRHEQVIFGGARLAWQRVSVLLAGGAANATRCSGAGDQSSYCTRSRENYLPVARLSAEIVILPVIGLHFSTLQPARRDVAFSTYMVGLAVGKLR